MTHVESRKRHELIAADIAAGQLTAKQIAEKYGVSARLIYDLSKGRKFKKANKLKHSARDEQIYREYTEEGLTFKQIGEKHDMVMQNVQKIVAKLSEGKRVVRTKAFFANRDKEIYRLRIEDGLTSKQIADKLGISPCSVRHIVSKVKLRLGAKK